MPAKQSTTPVSRPPVIVITGHIDHGKSTLLDYIRKSNIVAGEAGGITQHLSAYEVAHKKPDGSVQNITFLDTPGHEAFSGMRERGVSAADIAILLVSAEDSVKAQTMEAIKTIKNAGLPFIVAINKIDRPAANVEKVKNDLVEQEVYLEGYGGDVPFVPVSAKTGQGVSELLDMILLVAELKELTATLEAPARGVVIESHLDPKRGVSVTLIVKDGTLKKGEFLVIEDTVSPVRIAEDFMGKPLEEAPPGTPVFMAGLGKIPRVGAVFATFEKKKDAEAAAIAWSEGKKSPAAARELSDEEMKLFKVIPLTLKADTQGTLEALEKEVLKIKEENVIVKVIQKGVGAVSENDIRAALGTPGAIIVGFNVRIEGKAKELAEREHVLLGLFDIIYKLTEWLAEEVKNRRPKVKVEEITGTAKIVRTFSRERDRQVVGGRVTTGVLSQGSVVRIMRRDFEIGTGKIVELQSQKVKSKEVAEGKEFGVLIDAKMDIAEGDTLQAFMIVEK